MASSHRAPKQWCLSKVETINSFENWKKNLLYTLSLDSNFAPFLADVIQWLKKTKSQPLRGLEADGDPIPLARRLTAWQKVKFLELMLGQIANYWLIISRSTLVKNSTSHEYIWQTIRKLFVLTIMILNYSLCYWTVTFKSVKSLSSAFKYFPLCFWFHFSRLNVVALKKRKRRSHASTGQRYCELACVICCSKPSVRHIVTVTRLLVIS